MSWFKRNRCPHANIRGVYGDEIIFAANWRRLQCVDCWLYLDGPLVLANVHWSSEKDHGGSA